MQIELNFNPTLGRKVGLTNWIFFGVSGVAVLLFLLQEAKNCDLIFGFCSITIFSFVFLYSLVLILLLAWVTGNLSREGIETESVRLFFLQDISLARLLIVIPAFIAVVVVSWWSVTIGIPFLGVFFSGLIMSSVFLVTSSAIPVMLIHGFYNAFVVLQESGSLFNIFGASTSPIGVPRVGIDFLDNTVLSEILSQMFLVSPAEEIFRIFMIFLFIIIINTKFDGSKPLPKIIAMIVSVSIWSIYHLQLNPNLLPF